MSRGETESSPQAGKHKPDFKIVILGQKDVGKTTLIFRYMHRKFTETVTTIGASFFLRRHNGKNFALWDTAGEERFSGLSALYSRDASAAILAFDISCRDSFESLRTRFLPMLNSAKESCVYVVVATKLDLLAEQEPTVSHVDKMDAKRFSLEINSHLPSGTFSEENTPYFETSAKTGEGIDELFSFIFGYLLEKDQKPIESETVNPGFTNDLDEVKGKKNCCK